MGWSTAWLIGELVGKSADVERSSHAEAGAVEPQANLERRLFFLRTILPYEEGTARGGSQRRQVDPRGLRRQGPLQAARRKCMKGPARPARAA